MPSPDQPEPVIGVSDDALTRVRGYRTNGEAMWLEVTGTSGDEYLYSLFLADGDRADPGDARERHGDLDVVVPAASVPCVRGATVDWADEEGGLVVLNPNAPCAVSAPAQAVGAGEVGGEVADRVARVLEEQINPAIAAHGGRAELVGVDGDTALLRLGGGCQGCGLAGVTVTQGIEAAIRAAVPEIARVSDVTDHGSALQDLPPLQDHSPLQGLSP